MNGAETAPGLISDMARLKGFAFFVFWGVCGAMPGRYQTHPGRGAKQAHRTPVWACAGAMPANGAETALKEAESGV